MPIRTLITVTSDSVCKIRRLGRACVLAGPLAGLLAGACLVAVFAGCGPRENLASTMARMEVDSPAADVRTVKADWNDLDAALFTGTEESEVAVLPDLPGDSFVSELSPSCRVFELISVNYGRGTLVAAFDAGTSMVTLRAEIRRPGTATPDHARTTALLDGVARRLAELRGVGWMNPDTGEAGR